MNLLERVKKAFKQSAIGASTKSLAERSVLGLMPVATDAYRWLRRWADSQLGAVHRTKNFSGSPESNQPMAVEHERKQRPTPRRPTVDLVHPIRRVRATPSSRRRQGTHGSRPRAKKLPGRPGFRSHSPRVAKKITKRRRH